MPIEQRQFGYSLFSFTESMNAVRMPEDVLGATLGGQLGVTDPDDVATPLRIFHEVFNIFFFIMIFIILMNVLIAMMSNTFSQVIAIAEEEWRLVFAGMVREYFDATVLPPPFNLLELLANRCMSSQMEDRSQAFAAGKRGGSWGQHYLWPVPALRFSLPAAMQMHRTGRKDVGQQGIKNLSRKLDSLLGKHDGWMFEDEAEAGAEVGGSAPLGGGGSFGRRTAQADTGPVAASLHGMEVLLSLILEA